MNDNANGRAFACLAGVCAGMILGMMFVHYYHRPLFERHIKQMEAIAECEASLPRNKTCTMVAQPN